VVFNKLKKLYWLLMGYESYFNVYKLKLEGIHPEFMLKVAKNQTTFCPQHIIQGYETSSGDKGDDIYLAQFAILSHCPSPYGAIREIYPYLIEEDNKQIKGLRGVVIDNVAFSNDQPMSFCYLKYSFIVFQNNGNDKSIFRFDFHGGNTHQPIDPSYLEMRCIKKTGSMLVLGKNSINKKNIAILFNGESEYDARNQVNLVSSQSSTQYSGYFGEISGIADYSDFFFLVKNTESQIMIQAQKLTQPKLFFHHPNDYSDTFVPERSIKIHIKSQSKKTSISLESSLSVALFNLMDKVECFSDYNSSNIIAKGEYHLDAKKLKGPIFGLEMFSEKEDDQI